MREAAQLADLRIVHMGDRRRQNHVFDVQPEVNGQAVNNVEQVETSRNVKAEYEVELILDKRMVGEVTEYLVMWRGWPDGTWEPVENLKGSERLVKRFEKLQKSAGGCLSNGCGGEKRARDRNEDRKRVKKRRSTSESENSEYGGVESRETETDPKRKELMALDSDVVKDENDKDTDYSENVQSKDESTKENGQDFEMLKEGSVDKGWAEKEEFLVKEKSEESQEEKASKEEKVEEEEEEEKVGEEKEEEEEEEWEVEKILKKRKSGGETQYLVKWVGWEEVPVFFI